MWRLCAKVTGWQRGMHSSLGSIRPANCLPEVHDFTVRWIRKGLALSGLALCQNSEHIPAAKEAYKAARAINSDAGVVGRALQLFDTLAKADTAGILAEIRVQAAREKPQ